MKRTVSIKVNLLTYFLIIIFLVSGVVIGMQYYFSIKLAHDAAEGYFKEVAEQASMFNQKRSEQIHHQLNILTARDALLDADLMSEQTDAISILTGLLNSAPELYSAYIGKNNDNFFQLINLNIDERLRERYQVSPEARWLVVRILDTEQGRIKYMDALDEQLSLLGRQAETSSYYPSSRPWFMKARLSSEPIVTEIYNFTGIEGKGITFAQQQSDSSGIIGVDLSLQSLRSFLGSQTNKGINEIFIFDNYGFKYISSDKNHNFDPARIKATGIITAQLTDEEQAYIKQNPHVRVSNETDWAPMDYAINGIPTGYNIDLINLLAAKTGLQLKFYNGLSWPQLMQLFQEKQLDIMHSAYWTEKRSQFANFSDPLYTLNFHIISRKDADNFSGIETLKGKTIAMQESWKTTRFMQQQYPDIKIKTYPKIAQLFLAVDSGEVDAAVAPRISYIYHKNHFQLEHLQIGNRLEALNQGDGLELFMMTQPENPILGSILNKALDNLTASEIQQLNDKWFNENLSERHDSLVPAVLAKIAENRQPNLVKYNENDVEKLTYLYPLKGSFSTGHTVGVTADQDFLMAPYLQQVKNSIYMALGVIVIAIFLVLYLTKRLTRPIEALMHEKQKIQQRQFSRVKVVKTHITEFLSLSNSMINMSNNIRDYQKMQEALMDSFLKLIAGAIDTKSPYTGGHCERVPDIAMMLAEAACQSSQGEMAGFSFENDDQWREFRIGSWLHDCGKVTTPEYVVDKATKLETINNRIHEIRTRFEIIWRDLEITAIERKLAHENAHDVDQWLKTERAQLQDDFAFVAECNIGGEFMSDDKIERLKSIASRQWQRYFSNRLGLSDIEMQRFVEEEQKLPVTENLLSDKAEHIIPRENFDYQEYQQQGFKLDVPDNLYNRGELYNLSVRRGTLTDEERFKINDHVIQTIRMLEKLPFPDNMQRVVEYAGTHHETLNGKGYPRKLCADELSLPARIMAIADIFEALTASDRPYKKEKTLSEAIKIMTFMVKDEHIDKDLFELFLRSGVYKAYAENALLAEQIDQVDIEAMLA